ncbi:hypothetical protein D5086_029173 [Populus alba]|uniref:Uncharacterized protein n=1 Tax=Populus alba TaxID=43335 RepID=A0ACC4AU34_POPAL
MKSVKGRFLKKLNFIPSISTLKQGLVSHLNSSENFSDQNLQIPPVYIQKDHKKDSLAIWEELWRIMGGRVIPPRLFIKGRYIGGADEVTGLHEQGKLKNLLAVVRSLQMIRMMRHTLDALNVMKMDWLNASSAAEDDEETRLSGSKKGKDDDNMGKNPFNVGLCQVWSLVQSSLNHCQDKFGTIMGWENMHMALHKIITKSHWLVTKARMLLLDSSGTSSFSADLKCLNGVLLSKHFYSIQMQRIIQSKIGRKLQEIVAQLSSWLKAASVIIKLLPERLTKMSPAESNCIMGT